jgi:alkanesulfonate monooxygenase SsuD/methylene tetrahydromethanopterin reductase-like flavin-dependent oxidoreductase (luciferase family)
MEFGFTLKPDVSLERAGSLARLAEECGFTYGWIFDSHVLWKEPYVPLTLMAQATKRMRLGTCVTNPATREPSVTASTLATLQILSGGRFDLGIGRGDSARRVLGKPPTTLAVLEEATRVIKGLAQGESVTYEGTTIRLEWAQTYPLPVWIAGYGPKALEVTARVADGAIIQLADPSLVGWCATERRRWVATRTRSRSWPPPLRTSARVRRRSSACGGSPRSCRITSSIS